MSQVSECAAPTKKKNSKPHSRGELIERCTEKPVMPYMRLRVLYGGDSCYLDCDQKYELLISVPVRVFADPEIPASCVVNNLRDLANQLERESTEYNRKRHELLEDARQKGVLSNGRCSVSDSDFSDIPFG